jgi:hypothetical protein
MARKYALTVEALKFNEKDAYNHNRPISSLIRTQLLHLHTAENLWLPEKKRTGININYLHTEHQASQYIGKVTALLHGHGETATAEESRVGKKAAKKGRKDLRNKSAKTGSAARKRVARK